MEGDPGEASDFVFANRRRGARKNDFFEGCTFSLSSRADAALSSGPSHLSARITFQDAGTGGRMLEPVMYAGHSEYDVSQPKSLISTLTRLLVEPDYEDKIGGFAGQVNEGLFGLVGTRSFAPPGAEDDEKSRAVSHDAGSA